MNYKNSKGFASILVFLIISALFLSGGGIYEYRKIKSENKQGQGDADKNGLISSSDLKSDAEKSSIQKTSGKTNVTVPTSKSNDDENDDEDENESEMDEDDSRAATPSSAPQNTQVPNATQVQSNPAVTSYTLAEVKAHASAQNCWTTINGSVYNVTNWISQHPGGSEAIISLCGTDGTSAFSGQHGSQARPASELLSFKIGVLSK